jgi:transketolase
MREAYGRTLVELGREYPDIVVLDADLAASTMTKYFMAEFPERSFDIGIAEQNMIGIAAGLAASGKIPIASTFAVFAPGRCFDQIRVSIVQSKLNVKLVVTHGGLSVGEDGISHQAIEDLSLICSLPGFTVIVPADAIETAAALRAIVTHQGPCYVRLGRPNLPVVLDKDYTFEIGKAFTMKTGTDATIIAVGIMVYHALEAAAMLAEENIDCRVLNMSTIKPIDRDAVLRAAVETGAIVTAEEHMKHGGLGATVAQLLGENRPTPIEFIAVKDTYAQSGRPAELLARYGLTAEDIAQSVRKTIKRKG